MGTLSGTTGWCLRVSSRELDIVLAGSIAGVLMWIRSDVVGFGKGGPRVELLPRACSSLLQLFSWRIMRLMNPRPQ